VKVDAFFPKNGTRSPRLPACWSISDASVPHLAQELRGAARLVDGQEAELLAPLAQELRDQRIRHLARDPDDRDPEHRQQRRPHLPVAEVGGQDHDVLRAGARLFVMAAFLEDDNLLGAPALDFAREAGELDDDARQVADARVDDARDLGIARVEPERHRGALAGAAHASTHRRVQQVADDPRERGGDRRRQRLDAAHESAHERRLHALQEPRRISRRHAPSPSPARSGSRSGPRRRRPSW
jgi:hypothetical protein